jgi:hypothetical protein
VVLYSLPELDGAIDTVPLGGLVGDSIFLVPERVKRLSARLRKWVHLRRTPPAVRRAPHPSTLSCHTHHPCSSCSAPYCEEVLRSQDANPKADSPAVRPTLRLSCPRYPGFQQSPIVASADKACLT